MPCNDIRHSLWHYRLERNARRVDSCRGHFYWQERDYDILRAVYEYRVLSTPEIEQLLFPRYTRPSGDPRSNPGANARLRYRADHGYLERKEQLHYTPEGRKPYLYILGRKGALRLADKIGCDPIELDWHPKQNQRSDYFYNHMLACNRLGFRRATGVADPLAAMGQAFPRLLVPIISSVPLPRNPNIGIKPLSTLRFGGS